MAFLDDDFLLTTDVARKLYHTYAEKVPIIDYHCHLNPKDIYENKNYPNLTRIWLNDGNAGDHYKWRLERANGVPEELITGDADEYKKLEAWAGTIEKAIGNPIYEWAHLELRRFFDIEIPFTVANVPEIWEKTKALLQTEEFKPRNLIRKMNVKVVCTTDDPVSDLKYHILLAKEEAKNGFKVAPAMRPDKLMNIMNSGFQEYIKELSTISKTEITNYASLKAALENRFEFFASLGGSLSDLGINSYYYNSFTEEEFDTILKSALAGKEISANDISKYQTAVIFLFMYLCKKYDWTLQFHINVLRNNNTPMFHKIGVDAGYDSVGSQAGISAEIMKLLDYGSIENAIPRIILYSTNPNDWMELSTGMQCFQGGCVQRLQLGCAWWFNDTKDGMRNQLTMMAQQSLLANFTGMLTDSRSFLSYPRHEYFRRVLCELIGDWVKCGQVQEDYPYLGKIVEAICYSNAKEYFRF